MMETVRASQVPAGVALLGRPGRLWGCSARLVWRREEQVAQ